MKQQLDMLCSCPWDVLIVLDACRADCFGALASNAGVPGGEAVRSPAVCTARFWPTWGSSTSQRTPS